MNLKARNPFALAGPGAESATASVPVSAPLSGTTLSGTIAALQLPLKQLGAQLLAALRWVDRSYTQQRLSKRMKVAETVSLGEKRFVSILQVDGAQFLIGGTASSISLLATMGPMTEPKTEPPAETGHQFAEVLRRKAEFAGAEGE